MRASRKQRRARSSAVVTLAWVALLACDAGPQTGPGPRGPGPTAAAGEGGGDAGARADADPNSVEAICRDNPELAGCPWDEDTLNTAPEEIRGNASPDAVALRERAAEPCPDSAVMGDMVAVPAGPFVMGCDSPDSELCGQRERERTRVDLPAFEIDRTEVTQAAYARCVEAGVCTPPAGGFYPREACTHPVANVSWKQAGQYCAWRDKRLPTEAEWEKAARGTDERRFPWGDAAPTCARANFADCGRGEAEAVGSHPSGASPYGALDMAGNVREWVFDRESERARQPKRGIRGGMFTDPAMHLRAARRQWGDVSVSDMGIGFRCAR